MILRLQKNSAARKAFTLVELMVALAIGTPVAGGILFLLWQTAQEQQHGFADTNVEQKAYVLEANMTAALRAMSATMGMTPVYSSAVYDTNNNFLGYQSISVFAPSNGNYTLCTISYASNTGAVSYVSNVSANPPAVVWFSNTSTAMMTNMYFNISQNLDSSQNSSLVSVTFQMNDNGFSQQSTPNNPTSILRTFAVQMRNDN